jgi:hypothetical protein
MFAALIVFAHLADSAFMYCVSSCGVLGDGSAPCGIRRWLTSGDRTAFTTAAFSSVTIGAGVPRGAKIPYHVVYS